MEKVSEALDFSQTGPKQEVRGIRLVVRVLPEIFELTTIKRKQRD